MSDQLYTQMMMGIFPIISATISAMLTYYFSQKLERNKRRFKKIDGLKLWVTNLSIGGFMQSVEYYEIRYLMNNQEKKKLDSQIAIVTSKYDKSHTELDNDFQEWKKAWDMSLAAGSPSKTEPISYYTTMKELMHKRYMLETQENLANLKEVMIATLCRSENNL